MPPAPDRSHTRRDTALFFICCFIAIGLMFAPPAGSHALASFVRGTALAPLVWLQERAEEAKAGRSRLNALQAQRDSLAALVQGLPALELENERLRQLFGLQARLPVPFEAAEVLHQVQATDGLTLLLSAGSSDGVAQFQPVVAPEGLIGVVRSVEAHSSIATTWAHPEFRASAVTADGSVSGIVAPTRSPPGRTPQLELRGVPYRDSVPTGAWVLTSGLGGVYPAGIPIGTVVGVVREQAEWERVYLVRPMVSPDRVRHVLILTGALRLPVPEAFPSAPPSEPPDG